MKKTLPMASRLRRRETEVKLSRRCCHFYHPKRFPPPTSVQKATQGHPSPTNGADETIGCKVSPFPNGRRFSRAWFCCITSLTCSYNCMVRTRKSFCLRIPQKVQPTAQECVHSFWDLRPPPFQSSDNSFILQTIRTVLKPMSMRLFQCSSLLIFKQITDF